MQSEPTTAHDTPDPGSASDAEGPAHAETTLRLRDQIRLFHDASPSTVIATTDDTGAISLRIGAFDGAYLSLAVPVTAPEGLDGWRPVTLDLDAAASRPITVLLRLNLVGEGGREHRHDALILTEGPRQVSFDLLAFDLDQLAPEDVWVDVILSNSAHTDVRITQLEATG